LAVISFRILLEVHLEGTTFSISTTFHMP